MRTRDMIQRNLLMLNLSVVLLASVTGCLPTPQRQQTKTEPAADVVISIEKGKTVVGPPAKASPEGEAAAKADTADSEK